jgi:hydroxymethylbilane synthase
MAHSTINKTLKLGTRRSLLAIAQSTAVARALESAHPGLKVELVGIETQGDRIQDVPLSQVEGKDFFVAELDTALKEGRVDFNVHSLKDLSLERPREFAPLVIPHRENPRDVVIYGPGVAENPWRDPILRVGTSAPRRLENLPSFLKRAYPRNPNSAENKTDQNSGRPEFRFIEIRGNVNTRLARLHEPRGSDRHVHAVVLALAGLHRLLRDETAAPQIQKLLQGTRLQVMPLTQMPTAPAQGALALEFRRHDPETLSLLQCLHHEETATAIAWERSILKEWGGGCHLSLGATAQVLPRLGLICTLRGRHPLGHRVEEIRWARPPMVALKNPLEAYVSAEERQTSYDGRITEELKTKVLNAKVWFVAHSRALEYLPQPPDVRNQRIYVAGEPSWYRLADRGLWVEGSAEGQGMEPLLRWVMASPLLAVTAQNAIHLTHQEALSFANQDHTKKTTAPQAVPTVATYAVGRRPLSAELRQRIHLAKYFYWTSFSQFDAVKDALADHPRGSDVVHCSGPGKTAELLEEHGRAVLVFPSLEEWKKWLNQ